MKVKFGFKKIYSESDTITVNADDEQIMLFKKSDFNNDWQNLVNNGVVYEIAPYKVSRLETLTCKGAEVKIQSIVKKQKINGLNMLDNL